MKLKLMLASMLVALSLVGCGTAEKDEPKITAMEDMVVAKDFKWSNKEPIKIKLKNTELSKESDVSFSIWAGIPEEEYQKGNKPIIENAHFELDGTFETLIETVGLEKLYIQSNYIGMESVQLDIEEGKVEYDYNYDTKTTKAVRAAKTARYATAGLNFLSEYDAYGVPNAYSATNVGGLQHVEVSQTMIKALNKAFPEQTVLSADKIGNSDVVIDVKVPANSTAVVETEVKLTLVHEGAGFQNSLGYYTYDVGTTPTEADLKNIKMVFANVETGFLYEGDASKFLKVGDTVSLGKIPNNKSIGFVVVAEGWNQKSKTVEFSNSKKAKYYSTKSKNTDNLQHIATYSYKEYSTAANAMVDYTIIGVEDILGGGDKDYNDIMFYLDIKSKSKDLPIRKTTIETTKERYPQNGQNTVAYEDMWPQKADYDFNDQVVGINYELESQLEETTETTTETTIVNGVSKTETKTVLISKTNTLNKLTMNYTLKAAGAGLNSGFAIALGINPSLIEKVEGQKLGNWKLNIASNGVEAGTNANESVIVIYDDANLLLSGSKTEEIVNTMKSKTKYAPVTGTITITFKEGTNVGALVKKFPFNPFIFWSFERGHEIHVAGNLPTSLANPKYFMTENDASILTDIDTMYKTAKYLPWALEITGEFKYPVEFCPMTTAYPAFASWAGSRGTQDTDWASRGDATKLY